MPLTNQVFLLLGSNQGKRRKHLENARQAIAKFGHIEQLSQIYLTKAWGDNLQPDHYNQALELQTALGPEDMMQTLLQIERELGRERRAEMQPRTIDLDMLFYEDLICASPLLSLPHPRIAERNFVLVPMMEIAPQLRHPLLEKTIEELYLECPDHLEVLMLEHDG